MPFGWLNPCQGLDGGLETVAKWVLDSRDFQKAAASLSERLLMAGVPYPSPRLWMMRAPPTIAAQHLRRWLAQTNEPGEVRCGVAWAKTDNEAPEFVVVAANALLDVAPVPRRLADPSTLRLRGRLVEPATAADVVVLRPSGTITRSPIPLDADPRGVSVQLRLHEIGRFHVQVVADLGGGPRPVAELALIAGPAPADSLGSNAIGAEDLETQLTIEAPSPQSMLEAINQARENSGLKPLRLRPGLSAVAQGHARAMGLRRRAVHVLDGQDAGDRLASADLAIRTFGENVARGGSLRLIHDALMKSPSHRANILRSGFTEVGLGVHATSDGSYWVCQLFAAP